MALDIELPEGLRRAGAADWKQVGDITGEAFETDPVNLWIFGNTGPLRRTFSVLAQEIYLKHGICHLAGDGGATMWIELENQKELGIWPVLIQWTRPMGSQRLLKTWSMATVTMVAM